MIRPIIAATATLALLGSVACAGGDKSDTTTTAANETESTPSAESTPSMTPPADEAAPAAEPTELATAEPMNESVAGESDRVGMGVYDANGQQVGVIDEIIVAEDGTEQAVISVGTYLGLGTKKIAVPTLDLALDVDGARYTTTMTADEIEAAPEYVPAQPEEPQPQQ
jgi:hypothetical protein